MTCGIHDGVLGQCEKCVAAYLDIASWPKVQSKYSIDNDLLPEEKAGSSQLGPRLTASDEDPIISARNNDDDHRHEDEGGAGEAGHVAVRSGEASERA